jgi:hypothetical protein
MGSLSLPLPSGVPSGLDIPNLVPLFSDARWVFNPHATLSPDSKILTLVATSSYQGSYVIVPVLPNNKYKITVGQNNGYVYVSEYYKTTLIKDGSVNFDLVGGSRTLTTGPNTNALKIYLSNYAVGTFTFSDISLKLLM